MSFFFFGNVVLYIYAFGPALKFRLRSPEVEPRDEMRLVIALRLTVSFLISSVAFLNDKVLGVGLVYFEFLDLDTSLFDYSKRLYCN